MWKSDSSVEKLPLLAIVDGHTAFLLDPAQDHKRLGNDDTGPNTGGMGAFCPSPVIDENLTQQIQQQILIPTLDGMMRLGTPYRGVLYMGLMLTTAGPKLLEYNCRFGDPEAQAILPRLKSDLLGLLNAAVDRRLDEAEVRWDPRHALCVVMASGGYPGPYQTGEPIAGLPEDAEDLVVFHAGTKRAAGKLVTAGGRVLGVTALGDELEDARIRAYGAVENITFPGAQYRTDLGR